MAEARGGGLRFGVELTTRTGRLEAGRTPRWSEVREWAQLAEQVGFDTIWIEDHLIQAGLDYYGRPIADGGVGFWECWSIMAALAAATERISIGPYVACSSFRNPALLAKTADTLDEISDGRLILCLGAGWHQAEYDAFGFPYDYRVSRFEEALQIIKPLLRTGHVDFQGKFYTVRDCELRPRGPRSAGPPIWIGGRGPRVIGLAARYADGFDTYGHVNVDTITQPLGAFNDACRTEGRALSSVARSVAIYVALPGADGDLTGLRQPAVTGTPTELAAQFRAFEAAGVDHLSFIIGPGDARGLERIAPALEVYRTNAG